MFKFLQSPEAAQWGSALLVVVASAVVGRQAAIGMETWEWARALAAVAGSIGVAVAVRVGPAKAIAPRRPR